MQGITIKTRKTENGYREILEIKALTPERLPKKYIGGCPCCFKDVDGDLAIFNTCIDYFDFVVGELNTEEDFQKWLVIVRRCGERLAKINRKNNITKRPPVPVHSDIETFTI